MTPEAKAAIVDSTLGDALLLYVTPFTGTTNASAAMHWVETD